MSKVRDNSDITPGVWRDYYKESACRPLIYLAEQILLCYEKVVPSQGKARRKTTKVPPETKSCRPDMVSIVKEAFMNAHDETIIMKNKSVFVELKEKLEGRSEDWAKIDDFISRRAYDYLTSIFPLIKNKRISFDQSKREYCNANKVVGHARGILELDRLLMPYAKWKESELFAKELAYAEEVVARKKEKKFLSRLKTLHLAEGQEFWALDDNDLLLHEKEYQDAVTEAEAKFAGEDNEIIPWENELNYEVLPTKAWEI
jgi:hypothetical protein